METVSQTSGSRHSTIGKSEFSNLNEYAVNNGSSAYPEKYVFVGNRKTLDEPAKGNRRAVDSPTFSRFWSLMGFDPS